MSGLDGETATGVHVCFRLLWIHTPNVSRNLWRSRDDG